MKITRENIIDAAFGPYREYENYSMISCPYHKDDHPSMVVGDGFKCLGCGKKGTLHTLFMKLNYGTETDQRVRAYQQYDSVKPPTFNDAETFGEAAWNFMNTTGQGQSFWKIRGFIAIQMQQYMLGYVYPWAVIPIQDEGFLIRGIIFRYDGNSVNVPRYHIPYGLAPVMYTPDPQLFHWSETVFITFGLIDAISIVSLGKAAITTSGSGTNSFDARWLDKYPDKMFIILPDRGEEAPAVALQRQIGLRSRVHMLDYPRGTKDANDYLQQAIPNDLRKELRALV